VERLRTQHVSGYAPFLLSLRGYSFIFLHLFLIQIFLLFRVSGSSAVISRTSWNQFASVFTRHLVLALTSMEFPMTFSRLASL
jgi:hypothetical protein